MKITAKKMSKIINEALTSQQLKVAHNTLKITDDGVSIMSGVTKEEVIECLKKHETDSEKRSVASDKLK